MAALFEDQLSGISMSPFLSHCAKTLTDIPDIEQLLMLCVSPVDEDRHASFARLQSHLHTHGLMDVVDLDATRRMSNLIYDQIYDFDVWHPSLLAAGLTLPALLIPLREETLEAVLAAGTILTDWCWKNGAKEGATEMVRLEGRGEPQHTELTRHTQQEQHAQHAQHAQYAQPLIREDAVWGKLSRAQQEELASLAEALTAAHTGTPQPNEAYTPPQQTRSTAQQTHSTPQHTHSTGFFVKLSTRSPKDSLVATRRRRALQAQRAQTSSHTRGEEEPKTAGPAGSASGGICTPGQTSSHTRGEEEPKTAGPAGSASGGICTPGQTSSHTRGEEEPKTAG
eukprot:CAMPEP_0181314602 /NCGR_PEP_ID=MMETSP1101-20121128/14910_1 /TAXON_ID=46948 /ORGANISM="Rhodomonas abbreviata, Strain Caron Lab Isolate" /LENGTH=338 /DNA_ID=CAMNT_0023421715 /DNA_START=169 /DNA_END=1181 /DNA_ORIENTATION=+